MEEHEFEKTETIILDALKYGRLEFNERFDWFRDSLSSIQKEKILKLALDYLSDFADRTISELNSI